MARNWLLAALLTTALCPPALAQEGAPAGYTADQADEAATLLAEGVPLRGTPFTTLALVAAIHELTVAWLAAPEPPPIDELVAEGVRIITAVALSDPADGPPMAPATDVSGSRR